MYIMKINFSEDLLDSYEAVTDWLYTKTLEQFYTQGNEVPNVWPAVKDALEDPRFESLNITEHGFQCYIGLWRAINVNPPSTIHYPLPPLARIVPLLVATWNSLKGGGDTLTKIADTCQEQMGIRSEVLVASTKSC